MLMKSNEITIKSVDSGTILRFFDIEGDYFSIYFESESAKAVRKIWGYTDCEFLVDMFSFMAESWKGWDEELSWSSIEEEFEVSATCDKLGHVKLCILINNYNEGASEPFSLKASLNIEAGQLDEIAQRIKVFFNQ